MATVTALVASVTLVADPLRRERLEPWLRVVGEPVGYRLRWVEPHRFIECGELAEAHGGSITSESPLAPDVLVLDGPSMASAGGRASLLRAAHIPQFRYATLLYIEADVAERDTVGALSADDVVPPGEDQDAHLARLVQALALAPWKNAERLKQRAKALGDDHLMELPGGRPRRWREPMRFLDGATDMGPHLVGLVMESVRAGRRAGVEAAFEQIASLIAEYTDQIEVVRASLTESSEPSTSAQPAGLMHEQARVRARLEGAADAVVTLQEIVRAAALDAREMLEVAPSPLPDALLADAGTPSGDSPEDPPSLA